MLARFFFLAVGVLALAACDRPMLDEIPPDLFVAAPDLGVVQLDPAVTVAVTADAIRGVERVEIDGREAAFDASTGRWQADLLLSPGTNALPLAAFGTDGTVTRDTAFAVHVPMEAAPVVGALPEPRAGHSATRISGRTLLIAGGETTGGLVLGTARVLTDSDDGASFDDLVSLQSARTGHTATRLSDGRVLLLGGTSTPSPGGVSTFVAAPEVYDPRTQTTRPVFTRGVAVLRTNHIATSLALDGRQYLYVFGGQTPSPNGLLTLPTLHIAELRSSATADTLVTLTPLGGASGGVPLPDPTQIVLGSQPRQLITLETGLEPGANASVGRARRTLFAAPGPTYPYGVNPVSAELPQQPRNEADGVPIAGGLALLAGGVSPAGETLASLELYSDRAARWLAFPPSVSLPTPRRGHTVTLATNGRILAIGGRGPNGQILATLDALSF